MCANCANGIAKPFPTNFLPPSSLRPPKMRRPWPWLNLTSPATTVVILPAKSASWISSGRFPSACVHWTCSTTGPWPLCATMRSPWRRLALAPMSSWTSRYSSWSRSPPTSSALCSWTPGAENPCLASARSYQGYPVFWPDSQRTLLGCRWVAIFETSLANLKWPT